MTDDFAEWDTAPDYTVVYAEKTERIDSESQSTRVTLIRFGGAWHILSRAGIYSRAGLDRFARAQVIAAPVDRRSRP